MRKTLLPESQNSKTAILARGIIAAIVTSVACSNAPTVSSTPQEDANVSDANVSLDHASGACNIIEIESIYTDGDQVGESTKNTIRSGNRLTMNPRMAQGCFDILGKQGDRLEDGGIVLTMPVTVSIDTLDGHVNSISSNIHLTNTGTPARIASINLADNRLIPAGFTGDAELQINGGPLHVAFATRIWIDRNPPIFRASNPRLTSDGRQVTFTVSGSEATIFGINIEVRDRFGVAHVMPLEPNRSTCTVLPAARVAFPQNCAEGQTCVLTHETTSYCNSSANAGRTQDGRPTDFTITLPQSLATGESTILSFFATDLAGNRLDTTSTTDGDGGTMFKSVPAISISR